MYAVLLLCLLMQDFPAEAPEQNEEFVEELVPKPREIPVFKDEEEKPPVEVAAIQVPPQVIAVTNGNLTRKPITRKQTSDLPSLGLTMVIIAILLLLAQLRAQRKQRHDQ